MSDLLNKEEKVEEKPMDNTPQVPEKVKVGEKEYTQDELSSLVGLGETAKDFESKWNRSISQFYPDYTQKSQKLAEYEKKEKETEELKLKEKVEEKQDLTPEEQSKLVLQEADKYGFVHKGNVYGFVANFLQAKELKEDAEAVAELAKEEGKPGITTDDLIDYMSETGIKNPQDAYDVKFKNEVREWERKQLDKVKSGNGMKTIETSNAGGKNPPPPSLPKNWGDLSNAMRSYLENRRQA